MCFSIALASSNPVDGQISGWGRFVNQESAPSASSFGIRYIPSFHRTVYQQHGALFDLELSANLLVFGNRDRPFEVASVDPYRLWFRYSTPRFESRLGLQKINFGPAKLLRSLMWFDRLDPQDPLQLADGVYGLRLRYVLQNNADIWVWGLYGNTGTKGMNVAATEEKSPEYGGRFQYPVGNGEMAISVHSRVTGGSGEPVSERRIALDGVWDAGVGVLFESALIRTDQKETSPSWQTFLTLGVDYTLAVGSGLTLLCENLLVAFDEAPFGTGQTRNMSGLMMLYPMGLVDQLSYFGFYDWNDGLPYHYLSWQRNYDAWIYHLSIFWSTGRNTPEGESQSIAVFGIKGLQLMIIFNH